MYAIIHISGKQLRAAPDAVLEVPRQRAEPGQTIQIDRVLLVADGDKVSVGQPYVPNASVTAEVLEHYRGEKIRIVKYKPKKDSKRTRGYRSELTRIKVASIEA